MSVFICIIIIIIVVVIIIIIIMMFKLLLLLLLLLCSSYQFKTMLKKWGFNKSSIYYRAHTHTHTENLMRCPKQKYQ